MVDEDFRRQIAGEMTGSAIRFTDIDGIGPATEKKILSVVGVDAPKDVADMTAAELASKASIPQSRAAKAIKGGGGNPNVSTRDTSGSVSAAGVKIPKGDFKVEISDHDTAEARMSSSLNRGIGRTREAAQADKGKRAPITTDLERWKANKDELDFPGVDTPTDNPDLKAKDMQYVDEDDLTAEGQDEWDSMQSDDRSYEVDLPDWTASRLQTELNKQVYEEDRDDLADLRERVSVDEGTTDFTPYEYSEARQLLKERKEESEERAERMDANIFGDTERQAEIDREALQGLRNNPPQ